MQSYNQKPNLFQIGVVLAVVGVALQILMRLTWMLQPVANIAIAAGVILLIIGLVVPNRRF